MNMRPAPVVLVLSALLTTGCGDDGSAVAKRRSSLHELGSGYVSFASENGRTAAGVSELCDFMRLRSPGDAQVQAAITRLEEGDIVMMWNGTWGEESQNSKHVIAFEAGVPATGGYVVMGDGTVRLMTVKDYSEATMLPTAQPKASVE